MSQEPSSELKWGDMQSCLSFFPEVVSRRKIGRKRLKRPSCGGTWRAWVRRCTSDAKGRPNLRGVGARYRQAKLGGPGRDVFEECVAVGKSATKSGKRLGGSSFGLHKRQIQKNTMALAVAGLEPRLLDKDLPEQVRCILDFVNQLAGRYDALAICNCLTKKHADT